MATTKHNGQKTMVNYLVGEYRRNRPERWVASIKDETADDPCLKVLYVFAPDREDCFKNMHLCVEFYLHAEHPFKAPSIKVVSPNGRFKQNTRLCINGITVYHPETWDMRMGHIPTLVEAFMLEFLNVEFGHPTAGVGYITMPDQKDIETHATASRAWAETHYASLLSDWDAPRPIPSPPPIKPAAKSLIKEELFKPIALESDDIYYSDEEYDCDDI